MYHSLKNIFFGINICYYENTFLEKKKGFQGVYLFKEKGYNG